MSESQENKERLGAGGRGADYCCVPFTHSDEGEDVVHVRADVDLHKAHHHSHLLEEELEDENTKNERERQRDRRCNQNKMRGLACEQGSGNSTPSQGQ